MMTFFGIHPKNLRASAFCLYFYIASFTCLLDRCTLLRKSFFDSLMGSFVTRVLLLDLSNTTKLRECCSVELPNAIILLGLITLFIPNSMLAAVIMTF